MKKLPEIIEMEKLIRYEFDASYGFDTNYRTNYGFIRSLCMKNTVDDVKSYKNSTDRYENIVQVGIGGSALGASASCEFLGGIYHNFLNDKRYFCLDNIDAKRFEFILSLDLGKTLFHIVSKSGSTLETLAQFFVIYKKIEALFGDKVGEHFVFTTSKEGFLYEFAQKHNIKTFFIPDEVGGRYSVFSSVGLIPLAFLGYDIESFVKGAKTAVRAFRNGWDFPVDFAKFAIGEYKNSKNIIVMFVYKDRLKGVAEWFRQLWAESLGKNAKGQTPVCAVGTTDQHSQLQLYQDGPKDKTVVFVDVEQKEDFEIEDDFEFGNLKGQTVSGIMTIEKESTKKALRKNSVHCGDIFIKSVNEYSLGALYISLMIATAKAGELLGVNPFDQPGVELSKRYAAEAIKNGANKR